MTYPVYIGDRAAAAAIALAAGTDLSAVEAAVREFGDYGDVAYHLIEAPMVRLGRRLSAA